MATTVVISSQWFLKALKTTLESSEEQWFTEYQVSTPMNFDRGALSLDPLR